MSAQRDWQKRHASEGKCGNCGNLTFRGGRCWYHFVLRHCRNTSLMDKEWFALRVDKFITTLRGRYVALAAGGDVPAADDVIDLFEHGHRPLNEEHGALKYRSNPRKRLRKIIAHFDRMAVERRRESERTDTGTERAAS